MKTARIFIYTILIMVGSISAVFTQNALLPESPIHSQDQIQNLLHYRKHWADSVGTQNGFRVQIFSSSGPNSKTQALEERAKFIVSYPEKNAYLISQMPYFKVRVGDFRERMDALKFFAHIKPLYPNAFIVPDEIMIK